MGGGGAMQVLLQIVAIGASVPAEYEVGKRVCVENHFFCGHCYQCTHGELLLVCVCWETDVYVYRFAAHMSESESVWLW